MFKSRFLGIFCILSMVSNIFAIEFPLGNKKFDISIPTEFTLVAENSATVGITLLGYDYLLNNVTTKMLDIHSYANQNLTPQYMTNYMLANIRNSGTTVEVLEKHNNKNEGYLVDSVFIRASNNNKKFIIFISSLSSVSDLVAVFYSIDISTTMTEEQAIEEIKKFALESIKIV